MSPLVFLYTPQTYTNDAREFTAQECESPAEIISIPTGRWMRLTIRSDIGGSRLVKAKTSLQPHP